MQGTRAMTASAASTATATGSIGVRRLTCAIGAELSNVSLADAAHDDALFARIKALLLEHKVLFLRDQDISRADHVLRCVETPEVGGDTIWVNMAKVYEDLPQTIKDQIASLRASHSIQSTFGAAMPEERRLALKAQFPDAEHPVVRTHPETGEKVLFVNSFTTHFVNFHTPRNVRFGQDYTPGGANLLSYLIGRAAIPEYQVRWSWTPGSVVIWDNRATQHYAVQDYWPAVRKMERASIVGDRPF
jgi:taurine dioxygenase